MSQVTCYLKYPFFFLWKVSTQANKQTNVPLNVYSAVFMCKLQCDAFVLESFALLFLLDRRETMGQVTCCIEVVKTLNCEITLSKSREECFKNILGDGWRWDAVALESFAQLVFLEGDNEKAQWFLVLIDSSLITNLSIENHTMPKQIWIKSLLPRRIPSKPLSRHTKGSK